jgi:hypothetical protein
MSETAASETNPVETVQVYEDDRGEYRWRAIAGNGRIVATSGEGYVEEKYAAGMARRIFPGTPVVKKT